MNEKYKDLKIGICMAAYDRILPIAYSNHVSLIAKWSREICELVSFVVGGTNTADALGGMVEAGLERKCTHLFFMNDGVVMPEHLLPLLIDADLDIVSGAVNEKVAPFQQTCGHYQKGTDYIFQSENLKLDGKVHLVDFCCFEAVLIKMELFKKMDRPYFLDSSHDLGHMRIPYNKNHKRNFQEVARAKGAKIGVHTGVLLGRPTRTVLVTPDEQNELGFGKIVIT